MQTHESQTKLARLLDQEITRINQQQQPSTMIQCQELLDKTTDLMNAVTISQTTSLCLFLSFFLFLVIIGFITNKNLSYW
jgi:hypothetical protein